MNNNTAIPTKNNLIAPNLSGTWTPEQIWNTGFLTTYASSIGALAVERYPSDNCYAEYGIGSPVSPQEMLPSYLNHTAPQNLLSSYMNSTNVAQQYGHPFLMFEVTRFPELSFI